MTRAALLQTMGDPFILKGWLHLYSTIWKEEVDNLYILLHGNTSSEINEYCKGLITDNDAILIDKHGVFLQHGDAIRTLLEHCKEDLVVLLEDDGWIFQKGIVNTHFSTIENSAINIIGSTRGSCSPEISRATAEKFNLIGSSPEHNLIDCSNLWPNFLFCSRESLLRTDQYFNSSVWLPNEIIPILNMKCNTTLTGDTFVWATIQLRDQGLNFQYVHQYHSAPSDVQNWQQRKGGLFSVKPLPWTHFGSLSSLIGCPGLLRDENDIPLGSVTSGPHPDYIQFDPSTAKEISRRIAIAFLFNRNYPIEDSELVCFNKKYKQAIHQAVEKCNLPIQEISLCEQTYKDLFPVLFRE